MNDPIKLSARKPSGGGSPLTYGVVFVVQAWFSDYGRPQIRLLEEGRTDYMVVDAEQLEAAVRAARIMADIAPGVRK